MTCEVIKKEGIAHLPPLSFRSHHVSVPPQLCLRRAGLYAAFRLRCLTHVAALFAGAVVSACFILFQECYREPEAARQELMLVPNYCRKPPLPLCSTKDRSQGHMSNLNILCPHWFLQETELCLSLTLYFIFQLAFGGTILYQLLDYYCFV